MNGDHQGKPDSRQGTAPVADMMGLLRQPNGSPAWLRYGVAVFCITIAMLLDKSDFLTGNFRIYLVFYPFIVLATFFGGVGPGLLAIALACIAISFFWMEPVGKFAIAARADRVSMAIFIFGNLLFIWICERLRSALRHAALTEVHQKSALELARQAQLIKESEEQLHRFIASIPVGYIRWKMDGAVLDANDHFLRIIGYSREDLIDGRINWAGITPEEFRMLDRQAIEDLRTKGCFPPFEKVYVSKEGKRVPILVSGVLLDPSKGEGGAFILDLTEIKRTEEALRESETFAVSLRDSLNEHLVVLDAQGFIIAVNRSWQRFAENNGAPELAAKSLGINYLAICEKATNHPYGEEAAAAREGILAVLNGMQKEFTLEYPCHSPHARRWFQMHASPLRGARKGVVIAHLDITKRWLAEEALRQGEAFLRAVCETTPDPIFAKDCESRLLMANPATLRAFGKPIGEVLGRRDDELYADFETGRAILENDRRVIASGVAEVFEETIQTPYGRRVFLSTKAPYRDIDGRIIGIIGVARDITDRKQVEEALRRQKEEFEMIFNMVPAQIWYKDTQNGILRVNDTICRDIGLPREALEGHATEEIFPEFAAKYLKDDLEVITTGRPKLGIIEQINTQSGARLWIQSDKFPVRDEQGNVVGVLIFVLDLTERKQAEEALVKAKIDAENANHAKEQFIAVLSHELRTPLTPVLATVTTLEQSDLPEEIQRDMELVRRNVEMEATLIDDLLDVTRINSGKFIMNPESVNAQVCLQAALKTCQNEIDAKHLALSLSPAPPQHHVWADPMRLQQVFWNLLRNAVKFTPEGGRISVRSTNENGALKIEITDTGIGIPPEMLPRVFKPFEQEQKTTNRAFGGLGLGLSIAKAIVEMHQGSIIAFSEGKDKGATFTVKLATVAGGVPQPSAPPPAAPNGMQQPLKILLVDDHFETLQTMAKLLKRQGYAVTTTANVASTIDLAAKERFDLLISDLGLPDGSGMDIIRQMKRLYPLRGIALSGFGTEEDIRQSLEAGFDEHVIKPVSFEALRATIQRIMSAEFVTKSANGEQARQD